MWSAGDGDAVVDAAGLDLAAAGAGILRHCSLLRMMTVCNTVVCLLGSLIGADDELGGGCFTLNWAWHGLRSVCACVSAREASNGGW